MPRPPGRTKNLGQVLTTERTRSCPNSVARFSDRFTAEAVQNVIETGQPIRHQHRVATRIRRIDRDPDTLRDGVTARPGADVSPPLPDDRAAAGAPYEQRVPFRGHCRETTSGRVNTVRDLRGQGFCTRNAKGNPRPHARGSDRRRQTVKGACLPLVVRRSPPVSRARGREGRPGRSGWRRRRPRHPARSAGRARPAWRHSDPAEPAGPDSASWRRPQPLPERHPGPGPRPSPVAMTQRLWRKGFQYLRQRDVDAVLAGPRVVPGPVAAFGLWRRQPAIPGRQSVADGPGGCSGRSAEDCLPCSYRPRMSC
jgi:hypothetical protein